MDVELKYHLFGVLFLIPIIYGSLTLSWPGGIFAWCLALIWVLPTLLSWCERPGVDQPGTAPLARVARRHSHRGTTMA